MKKFLNTIKTFLCVWFLFCCVIQKNYAGELEPENTKIVDAYVNQGETALPTLLSIIDTGTDEERLIAYSAYFRIAPQDTTIYFKGIEDTYYIIKLTSIFAAQQFGQDTISLINKIQSGSIYDTEIYLQVVKNMNEKAKRQSNAIFPEYFLEQNYLLLMGKKYNQLIKEDLMKPDDEDIPRSLLWKILIDINDSGVIPIFIEILENPEISDITKINYVIPLRLKKIYISEEAKEEIKMIKKTLKHPLLIEELDKFIRSE